MTTNQNPNTTGAGLTQSLLPDWNTDHGGFNFGDLLILLFDGILLIYTGWRSFDLLSGTVPSGWEVMAFIGLLALDIGAVLWSYIWIFNSTTPWQDKIAMIFFVIDMSGVALTSITDSLLYGDEESVMLAMLEPITMVVIPLIIISNVIAGIVYHFTSADTRARRTKRQLEAKARDEEQRQQDEELQLHYAQQSLLRRQAELPRKIALANLKIAQDQLEKDAMQALFGNGDVARAMGGNIGGNSSSADTQLADAQAQLLALQSMGVNAPETNDDANTLGALGTKLNPANWNIFSKKTDEAHPPAQGSDVDKREESIQRAIEDALRENPDADRAAIEQALRGSLDLGSGVVTNPFMAIPKTTERHIPKWIFFRTNNSKHLIRTDQYGENVTLITGVPAKLKFAGRPSFFYLTNKTDNEQPKNIVRNALVPRYGPDEKLISPFFFMDGEEKVPVEIADWRNTAVIPEGNDIWSDDPYQEPAANPTKAGTEG